MFLGYQCRMDSQLKQFSGSLRYREKLDRVTIFFGELYIDRLDLCYAFGIYFAWFHGDPKTESARTDSLWHESPPDMSSCGSRSAYPLCLSQGQRFVKRKLLFGHLRQYEITCAVHDTVDQVYPIGNETFFQRAYYRDPAADATLRNLRIDQGRSPG